MPNHRKELSCAISELSERPSDEEIDAFLAEFDVDEFDHMVRCHLKLGHTCQCRVFTLPLCVVHSQARSSALAVVELRQTTCPGARTHGHGGRQDLS
eukprot:761550-Hanusia_phi.AAC.3